MKQRNGLENFLHPFIYKAALRGVAFFLIQKALCHNAQTTALLIDFGFGHVLEVHSLHPLVSALCILYILTKL